MKKIQKIINFLINNNLILTIAESCTAGQVIHILSKHEGCGECLDVGFVVYSAHAKKRLLNVKDETIAKYTLTSEPVAKEMVIGALKESYANIALSTTGIAGSEPMDGIAPGTICFGWGFKCENEIISYTKTEIFSGDKAKIQNKAAIFSLETIPIFYKKLTKENHKICQI